MLSCDLSKIFEVFIYSKPLFFAIHLLAAVKEKKGGGGDAV